MSAKSIIVAAASAGLLAAAVVPAAGQAAVARVATHSQLQRALDQTVNVRVPGAVLLARHGDRTVTAASGYSDVRHRTRMRATDRFRIGNVTTSFVATATMQLVGEGRLALDDTVESRLPGAIPSGASISIRQLLDMRSGLFDYLGDGDSTVLDSVLAGDWTRRWTPAELVALTNRHEPRAAPGAGWSYCSTCSILLGQIIERTTGHALGDELRSRIFVPAGLSSTTFDSTPQITGHHAHGYELLAKGQPTDVTAIDPSSAWASGAIVSTAGDVARFYRTLYRGRLLRADLVRAMQATGPMGELEGWGYGLGLIAKPLGGCGTAYGHDGAAFGYVAYAYSSKGGGRQSVVLANAGDGTMAHEDNGALQDLGARAYCG